MRRSLAVVGMIAVLGSAPLVAQAVTATNAGTSAVNCQATQWTRTAVSATPAFAPVKALRTGVTAIYPVTITVSGVVRGQPVAIMVVDRWVKTEVAQPGVVRVTPPGGRSTPFSFTWTAPGSSAAARGHTFDVSWRRTTATGASTLVKADVAVTYTTDVCPATR